MSDIDAKARDAARVADIARRGKVRPIAADSAAAELYLGDDGDDFGELVATFESKYDAQEVLRLVRSEAVRAKP